MVEHVNVGIHKLLIRIRISIRPIFPETYLVRRRTFVGIQIQRLAPPVPGVIQLIHLGYGGIVIYRYALPLQLQPQPLNRLPLRSIAK